jgi:hypothetical protein
MNANEPSVHDRFFARSASRIGVRRWSMLLLLVVCMATGYAFRARSTSAATDKTLEEQLIGSWRILSASFDGKESELHQKSVTIKHITPVQFVWLGYDPTKRQIFRSAGGSWRVVDGKYEETMHYGLDEDFAAKTKGKQFTFDCTFEGNTWTMRGTMPGGMVLVETWERIEPGEEVDHLPGEKK